MTETELKERLKQFSLRVFRLVDALPRVPAGRMIASQLVRAGASVGANYRAACRGRSRAEFISKLGVAEEEADESVYWLELVIEGRLLRRERVAPLLAEANELVAILTASRKSAARRSAGENRKSSIQNPK